MRKTYTLFLTIFILYVVNTGNAHSENFTVTIDVAECGIPTNLIDGIVINDISGEYHSAIQITQNTQPPKTKILILGTYHFDNPGLDMIKSVVPDILLTEQQEQLMRVFETLKSFQPSKIAVERVPESAHHLDSLYRSYLNGKHTLGKSETQQLGFRLAKEFNHSRVYPIDHRGSFPIEPVMAYAMKKDPAFLEMMQLKMGEITEEINRRHRDWTIGEILRQMNTTDELIQSHGFYLEINRVGAGDTQVGSDLLSQWYDRNIRIFSNLQAMAESGDHIIVIIGAGHAHILSELVRSDPKMELVDPLPFLPTN